MKSTKCSGGYIYEIPIEDISYIGYFYGTNGNEDVRDAYTRIKKLRGSYPDFIMNAELFNFNTRAAASDVVCGGKTHRLTQSYGIAFIDNKKPVFSYANNVKAPDYIGAYPVLIKGSKKDSSEPGGVGGVRGRTALGVSKESLYVALIPDNNGVSLSTLRNKFLSVGATDAINLDGGGSSQWYSPLGTHRTGRKVRGFIGIWLKQSDDIRKVSVRTSLNVRSGPGIWYKKIGSLYNGDSVKVLETKGMWCRLSIGWVSATYLKK